MEADLIASAECNTNDIRKVTKTMNKDDWVQYRPVITELYAANKLENVMEMMENRYGFRASRKMYKDRIRKWNIAKNVRGAEMQAAIRKTTQRSMEGKASTITVHGRTVSGHKLNRYRKRVTFTSDNEAATPPGMSVLTPPASPLTTPPALGIPERILKIGQNFVDGSFESVNWNGQITSDYVNDRDQGMLSDFDANCRQMADFLHRNRILQATQLFDLLLSGIKGILVSNKIEIVLRVVVSCVCLIEEPMGRTFAKTLLKQFCAMNCALRNLEHPLTSIFSDLSALDDDQFEQTGEAFASSFIDRCSVHIGYAHETIIWLEGMAAESFSKTLKQRTLDAVYQLLKTSSRDLGQTHARCLSIKMDVSYLFMQFERFAEALEVCEEVLRLDSKARAKNEKSVDSTIRSSALAYAARCYDGLQDYAKAEEYMRQATFNGAEAYGWNDTQEMRHMQWLADLVEESGRPEEATELQRRRDQLIDSRCRNNSDAEEKIWQECIAANPQLEAEYYLNEPGSTSTSMDLRE
ncbi:uncharacterized protein KY384_000767 [Bacidia gigantensis]|uniref:uncharacterized protein n=1 Tax=Bacidia gigantensis TaxID=2732470 RepID=UPI001D039612|nr:uncharacterized protein KY384_000767 [Bacidia gigantensis]KAG8526005.1 hypothetical protein KY384_000767 [Bacidia gigantensis]